MFSHFARLIPQALVEARNKETETEEHILKIAQREEGRLGQEIRRLKKELDELKEQKNIYEVCFCCVGFVVFLFFFGGGVNR